jgi:hypothetical protein
MRRGLFGQPCVSLISCRIPAATNKADILEVLEGLVALMITPVDIVLSRPRNDKRDCGGVLT